MCCGTPEVDGIGRFPVRESQRIQIGVRRWAGPGFGAGEGTGGWGLGVIRPPRERAAAVDFGCASGTVASMLPRHPRRLACERT